MPGRLIIEDKGSHVRATISNESRMNALDVQLRAELTEFWGTFMSNSDWKVCVLTGDGDRAFCVGRDLKETAESYDTNAQLAFEQTKEMGYPHLHHVGKPVIAAVNGHCVGGGLVVALGCPVRFCVEHAKFGAPQVARGRGTQLPLRLIQAGIPQAVVLDMTLSGESLDAARAHQLGMVSRVFPDKEGMLEEADRFAQLLSENSERVVQGITTAWASGIMDLPMNNALPLWDGVTGGMMSSDDDTRDRTVKFAQKTSTSTT